MALRFTLKKKLLRDLWGRKLALSALVVIVGIGVACYVAMASVYRDLDGARARYYRDRRLADFAVDLKRAPASVTERVAALPNVSGVRGRIDFAVLLDLPGVDEPITGRAISMPRRRAPVLNDVVLVRGGWFGGRDDREAILNESFAAAHGLGPGDRIKVTLLDRQVDLLIVGTALSPEFVYLIPAGGGLAPDPARFGVLYCPEELLERSCDLEGAVNQIIGTVHDDEPTAIRNTLELIGDELDAWGVTNTVAAADQPSVRFLADELAGLAVTSRTIPVVFLFVAALVLNVLVSRLVRQQRTVIGTLKALGYSSSQVTVHFLGYGVVVGFGGGVAGLALGWWMQTGLVSVYRQFYAVPGIEAHVYPDIAATGLAISVGFAILGTVKSVRHAASLAPAEAMQPPPPEGGHRILLERMPWLWGRLSFRRRLVLRSIFRNPFRSGVSVFASMVSTALVVTTLNNADALDVIVRHEFEQVSHQDVTVVVRDPIDAARADEVTLLDAIGRIEPQLVIVCDVENGARRKRIGVTGLPSGNELYTPLDDRGRRLVVPEEGLLLSRKLADILGVEVGDVVRLRPLIGRRETVRAPIVGIATIYLGLGAYADLGYLSRLVGEERVANSVLGVVAGRRATAELYRGVKERPAVIGVGERRRALDQIQQTFGEVMGTFIGVTVLFAGLIAFGAVLNTALVSLSEREREVATLRVLGYHPGQVSRIFSAESVALNGVGIGFGLLAGVGLTHLLSLAYDTELYRFPVVIAPENLALASALMAAFIAAAQLVIYQLIRALEWLAVLQARG